MFGEFFGKISFIEKIAKILSIFAFYLLIFWYYNPICFLTGAEMENIFSDKTETALIAERSAISAATPVDETALRLLENEAMRRLASFLSGETKIDTEDAPVFFGFIKVFGETENTDLRLCAKKAEAKITPVLKRFDHLAGYDNLSNVSAEEIERNIAALDCFERIDPFECDVSGKPVFPRFERVLKVIDNVEIVDDDGAVLTADAFKESILEAARIKTYMRLCVSDAEITCEHYLDMLQTEMEKALVVLFVMDKSAVDFPLDSARAVQIHQEFQKLLDVLE